MCLALCRLSAARARQALNLMKMAALPLNGAAANGLDLSRGWLTLSPHDPTKPPLPPLPPPAPSPSFIEIGECVRQVPTNDAIKVTACFAEPKGVATDWPLATD